jgi:hypothetical protein
MLVHKTRTFSREPYSTFAPVGPSLAGGYTLTSRRPHLLWMWKGCVTREMGRWKGGLSPLSLSTPIYTPSPPPLTARIHTQYPLPLLWLFRDRLFSAPRTSPFQLAPPKQGPHYVALYHRREWSEGGNVVPSCYESFQHTEPSPVVKIEITNTVRTRALDTFQRNTVRIGALDTVQGNTVRAGALDTVPRNTVRTGSLDTVPRNTVRTWVLDTVPRNTVRTGALDTVPRNTVRAGALDTVLPAS